MRTLLRLSLVEDIGTGDLTSLYTIPAGLSALGRVVAREALVVAGLVVVEPLIAEMGRLGVVDGAESLVIVDSVSDGDCVDDGAVLCTLEGPARAILTVERTVLNFLGHLSGIATETSYFVGLVEEAGASARILDTRKTTPGMRQLEKYAVCCGGGSNHRMGLFDAVLIKDNHVVAAGGVAQAVRAAIEQTPAGIEVEVECDNLEQVRTALDAGATAILLDNQSPEQVEQAVTLVAGRARVEVSGGVTIESVAAYALVGVDDISVGRLTHSARSADVAVEVSLLA